MTTKQRAAVPAQPAPTPCEYNDLGHCWVCKDDHTRPTPPTSAPTPELSDYDIRMIHSGLMIPNEKAIHSMAREIRKWRGEANPDAV